ncbi:antibiotic biosynthesis monooxygenase [Brevibacterium sp.]|uniref:putative quinol monooxygenase n=1 Tax=Brevibacterium sp. TaxID=1701 RepID=UPI002811010D|nr:antibiotic biosynthesis monooxygenase [Brevibacterium sp.]
MFRSVLTLRAQPEQVDAVLQLFRDEGILQESFDKTRQISSDIAVAADGSGEVVITADWPDEDGYQEWLDHPDRNRASPQLEEILAGAEVGVGKLYRIDQRVQSGSSTGDPSRS